MAKHHGVTDWTQATIEALDREPGLPWDIIADQRGPAPGICVCFATAGMAHAALTAAGFAPTGAAIHVPPLPPWHDPRSVLKYGRADGVKVVVARRLAATV